MIKKIILFICLICLDFISMAQQEPTFTHYSFNPLMVNPAIAGSKELLSVTAISRNRWLKFPGAPKTQNLTLHSILKSKRLGGGLSFLNDSKGPVQFTGLDLDVAYRLPVGEGIVSFGLKGGLRFMSAGLQSEVVTVEAGDVIFQNDVVFKPLANFGFGVHYAVNDFYVGISSPKLLENKLSATSVNGSSSEERNYYILLGGAFNLNTDESIKLKPSLFVKITESTLLQFDANFLFYFNDKYWLGPMYRSTNDVGLLAGLNVNTQLKFGYALDWSFGNKTATYNNGTHEIMLSYDFVFDKKQGIVSPRHF
ncbi:MAG: type IX secretion system membrane protein PorP/SprF [Crocinitomix sp.]|nr:type IX secretion system membrane protein PorP/SprF [Crocinitomix sp.]